MNIVSIMAHQDDEMRCLGTMLKCRARGDDLAFITLTDGSKGFVHDPEIAADKAAAIRHREMSALASKCGAKYSNLRFPDEFLYDTPEVRMCLIDAIRAAKPDVIFTHYDEDYNQDHVTTGLLVRHCAMQSALPVLPTEHPPLRTVPAIFTVPPHGAFGFHPTHFVDVGDYEDQKIELLKLHESQEYALTTAVGAGFELLSRRSDAFWGEQSGCEYAECFRPQGGRGTIKPFSVLP